MGRVRSTDCRRWSLNGRSCEPCAEIRGLAPASAARRIASRCCIHDMISRCPPKKSSAYEHMPYTQTSHLINFFWGGRRELVTFVILAGARDCTSAAFASASPSHVWNLGPSLIDLNVATTKLNSSGSEAQIPFTLYGTCHFCHSCHSPGGLKTGGFFVLF